MLGVSRPIYVDIDSPNLGFPYFNFLGGYQWEKNTLYICKEFWRTNLSVRMKFAKYVRMSVELNAADPTLD